MPETLGEVLPGDTDARVERVLKAVCDREMRLVTAESCTGGFLASLLTDVTGCGHAFDRGFVTYTREAKHELLGVPLDILEEPGPVSEVVARAMAEGALDRSHADLALSITGFAGPGRGATPGLVHVATALRGAETRHRRCQFDETDRAGVRLRCIDVALDMLAERVCA